MPCIWTTMCTVSGQISCVCVALKENYSFPLSVHFLSFHIIVISPIFWFVLSDVPSMLISTDFYLQWLWTQVGEVNNIK